MTYITQILEHSLSLLTGIYEVNVNLYKASGTSYNDALADLYVGDTQLVRIANRYADASDISHSSCSIIRKFTIGNTLYVRASKEVSYYGSSVKYSQFNIKYLGSASEGVWSYCNTTNTCWDDGDNITNYSCSRIVI